VTHDIYEKVRRNPKFSELTQKRSAFAWKLSAIVVVVYFTFLFIVAFYPSLLAYKIGNSVVSIGIPIASLIVCLCFLLTLIYTRRANNEFDKLIDQIKDDIRFES
jgi:uncharacterized membrane protein (DUF485 family)